tara:strand:- start:651 stop:830 length:180 start_codon:yes stop_codon:yes gene_type:complete
MTLRKLIFEAVVLILFLCYLFSIIVLALQFAGPIRPFAWVCVILGSLIVVYPGLRKILK